MRLVFLAHDKNNNGGAQKCLVDLLKGLKGICPTIKIYVIFPGYGGLLEDCLPYIDGYRVIRMSSWLVSHEKVDGWYSKILFVRKIIKRVCILFCYIIKIKPDYAITNTIIFPHLAWACRFLSVKHIWFVHEVALAWRDLSFVFSDKTVYKSLDCLSDKILVPSNFTKSFYSQFVPEEKIHVLNQSVDIEPLDKLRIKNERYTILLIGTFDSNKGQLELLGAVKKIVSSGRDIICYLVGDDSKFRCNCENFVKDNELGNHVVIEPFSYNVHSYYHLADVLIVCSCFETFGRVAVEAQKCGLPVILSNVGANVERVEDGVTGLLYEKGNVDDLVEKIEALRDENLRKKFVSRHRENAVTNYSIDSFATQFYSLLK